jgi:hypothetical protein
LELSFLQQYLEAFRSIEGWFTYDAALLFMAYNELIARQGITGDVLEIGVHHGLSAIATASLRGPGKRFYAVDLFEQMQEQNVSCSGAGNQAIFEQNMIRFYPDTSFMQVIAGPSSSLDTVEMGTTFSFCHIDGGHSRQETFHDLTLCFSLLLPGGLVAVDDYFNPEYPGVCEGAVQFMLQQPDALRPLAIGYNKIVFQKPGSGPDLNTELGAKLPAFRNKVVSMWDTPALLITSPIRTHLDLHASTPSMLVPIGSVQRLYIEPSQWELKAILDESITLPVTLINTSDEVLPAGKKVCGLSYHLLSGEGQMLSHDNDRAWLLDPLRPGDTRTFDLGVHAPSTPGRYKLEIDLVWEQVMWFKDVGNPTAVIELIVQER